MFFVYRFITRIMHHQWEIEVLFWNLSKKRRTMYESKLSNTTKIQTTKNKNKNKIKTKHKTKPKNKKTKTKTNTETNLIIVLVQPPE